MTAVVESAAGARAGRGVAAGRLFGRFGRRLVLDLASPLAALLVWQALVGSGTVDSRFWPAPSSIGRNLWTALQGESLRHDIALTTGRMAVGIAIGATAGLVVGLAMGLSRAARMVLQPIIAMTYPIPKIAILPLFLLVFGLGERSKWAIVAVGVFYLVALNTYAGIREIDPIYQETASVYGVSKWRRLRTVALPGALPLILTGLELGIGVGFLLIVAAEFVQSDAGLGHAIWQAWQTFNVPLMYAGLAVIAVYGLLIQVLMRTLNRRLVPWRIHHD